MISARVFSDYHSALRLSYEEEISGEGYFACLAGHFSGRPRDALLMIARMERVTATALRALIVRHGIGTTDQAALMAGGKAEAAAQEGITWDSLTRSMAEEYLVYMEEFDQLARLAPESDQAPITIAVQHERALIDFARREVAGDPRSLEPIVQFLAQHDGGRFSSP